MPEHLEIIAQRPATDKLRRVHRGFAQASIPVLVVYVAGELVGYLAGPGDALLKVE